MTGKISISQVLAHKFLSFVSLPLVRNFWKWVQWTSRHPNIIIDPTCPCHDSKCDIKLEAIPTTENQLYNFQVFHFW
jgi:hypothetical protein